MTDFSLPPFVYLIADSLSQLRIDIDGRQTVSSWYEIWEAVSAVAMMCTRQKKKGGKAKGIGTSFSEADPRPKCCRKTANAMCEKALTGSSVSSCR